MMCRYESRALSASDMGNKSFRFRISALIWSRRALDAPLVERYIVARCCGEVSKFLQKRDGELRAECLFVASAEVPRLRDVSRDRLWKSSGVLLDFHLSCFFQSKVWKPSPFPLPSAFSPPQRPARMLAVCWMSVPPLGVQVNRRLQSPSLAEKSGTRKSG